MANLNNLGRGMLASLMWASLMMARGMMAIKGPSGHTKAIMAAVYRQDAKAIGLGP